MKEFFTEKAEKIFYRRLQQMPDYVVAFMDFISDTTEMSSKNAYLQDIGIFFDFLIEHHLIPDTPWCDIEMADLDQIKRQDISRFFSHLSSYTRSFQSTRGKIVLQRYENRDAGKHRKLACLRKLYEFLISHNFTKHDPTRGYQIKRKEHATIKSRLTPEQIEALFQVILHGSGQESWKEDQWREAQAERDYLLILLLAYTGIRISELVQLDISDIQFDHQAFTIYRKGGKAQSLTMPQLIVEDLERYVQKRQMEEAAKEAHVRESALFLSIQRTRLTPKSIRNLLLKYQKRANLPVHLTPHVFRRTFGTNHYNMYHDMYLTAQVLGHSSAETTRKHYANPSEQRLASSMREFRYES